ncbi:MAG: hypothetical protein ABJD97_03680 [Betaproteobacteria bacterium]
MGKLIDNAVVPVSVTVTPGIDGNVNITCFPNPVPVNGLHTLLSFNLDTRGYRFRTIRSIELDERNSDFPFPSWTVSPTQATLYDLCETDNAVKYTVHVVNTITDVEYSVDPVIKNGGTGTDLSKGKGKAKGKTKSKR